MLIIYNNTSILAVSNKHLNTPPRRFASGHLADRPTWRSEPRGCGASSELVLLCGIPSSLTGLPAVALAKEGAKRMLSL